MSLYWVKVIYLAIAGTAFFWLVNRSGKVGLTEVLAGIIVGITWPIWIISGAINGSKKQ